MTTTKPAGKPRATMTKAQFLDEIDALKGAGVHFVLGYVANAIPSKERAAAIAAAKNAGYGAVSNAQG